MSLHICTVNMHVEESDVSGKQLRSSDHVGEFAPNFLNLEAIIYSPKASGTDVKL